MKKKLPIGIQSFEDIRKNDYLYVGKVYFLSRPRRFGKSLLISTIKSYFFGKKDLFKGLKIEKLTTDWAEYPVFHFDFGGKEYRTRKDVEEKLCNILKIIKQEYGLESDETSSDLIFSDLIQ